MKMHSFSTLALAAAAALVLTPEAHAREGGYVAAGLGAVPEYEGASSQQAVPFLAARYESAGRSITLDGLSLRADVLPSDDWEAGPVLTYTFGRDEDAGPRVSQLGTIDDAVEAGGYVSRIWTSGPDGARKVRAALEAVQDISDVHDGWIVTPSVSLGRAISPRLSVNTELSASFVSGDYAQTYFGITPAGAAASGLAPYEAEGGLKDVGIGFSWNYALNQTWSLTGFSGYRRLLGDAADSPLVDSIGDANQYSAGLGIGMAF
jgi:outer membrane scaffolding protein for murein synthesis (MipA/OmpV family)